MKLVLFLVADYANVTGDGKLNVMGIFGEIYAHNFPARHSAMHIVVKLMGELGEYGQKRGLTVKLLDPDGNPVIDLSGEIDVPMPKDGRKSEVNAIMGVRDIIFPKPGPYQFVVLVDKDHKGELTVYLNKIDMPTAPPQE
ncbi:MAG: hypothetical protein HZC38_19235 [Chloroflexi bacterium]|nr:hypothetical protein [Chloroflexota bacterium]MBI5715540.1 hypothetical protein [Chloroflexota bacterium]